MSATLDRSAAVQLIADQVRVCHFGEFVSVYVGTTCVQTRTGRGAEKSAKAFHAALREELIGLVEHAMGKGGRQA